MRLSTAAGIRPAIRGRALRLAAPAAAALVLLQVLSRVSLANDGAAWVKVGGNPIEESLVLDAVQSCTSRAPTLSPGACIDTYYVPRWLLDARAREENLAKTPRMQHRIADLLHRGLVETTSEKLGEPSPAAVDEYLTKNARDFQKPLRIRLFRILVNSESEAKELLGKLTPTTKLQDFRTLARDHSVDRATNERAGDLGFVWPDGSTDVPQVSADQALYRAAQELADGEYAKEPVKEGERFAVLWRRGSLPAQEVTEESRAIARLRITERDTEKKVRELLLELEKAHVSRRNDDLLGKLRREEATLFREP